MNYQGGFFCYIWQSKIMSQKMIKLNTLKLLDENPRVISPEDLEKLKNSLNEFPKMMEVRGIVVDNDNIIIGGNQRFKGLIALGYKEIPEAWVQKGDFNAEERRRFIVADNVGFGAFDYEKAMLEYDAEELNNLGVEVPKHYQLGNNEPHIPQATGSYETQHAVIVICDDVKHQKKVFDSLKSEGYNLKIVST